MKNKAFTLIELLVVIAIIGMLSSIVLVNTRSSREKARIAKALEFNQSISHILGSEAVGIWNFDGCNANDSSGYNNNGAITGATCSTDTPYSVVGQDSQHSMSFDGNDYVLIPASASLDVQRLTISAWTYSSDYNRSQFIFEKTTNGSVNTQYSFFLEGGIITLRTCNTSGSSDDLDISIINTGIQNNQWNHVLCTYDGSYKKIYVNGNEVGSKSYSQTLRTNPSGTSIIGAYGSGSGYFFQGLIDNVQVYSQSLTQSQIQQYYANSIARYKSLAVE